MSELTRKAVGNKKKTGRPKGQSGWMREKSGSWLGTWRRYGDTPNGEPERVTVNLGLTRRLGRRRAQEQLDDLIEKDRFQHEAVAHLGPMTISKRARGIVWRKMLPVDIGTMGELLVCADLLAKGFEPFKAVSHCASCDLIYLDGERLVRVEVKSVEHRSERTPRVVLARNAGLFDVLATVDRDGTITYRPHNSIGSAILKIENSDSELTPEGGVN